MCTDPAKYRWNCRPHLLECTRGPQIAELDRFDRIVPVDGILYTQEVRSCTRDDSLTFTANRDIQTKSRVRICHGGTTRRRIHDRAAVLDNQPDAGSRSRPGHITMKETAQQELEIWKQRLAQTGFACHRPRAARRHRSPMFMNYFLEASRSETTACHASQTLCSQNPSAHGAMAMTWLDTTMYATFIKA